MIDNRTIKRGSRMSNSVTSFGESSNLCILASSYLVVIWSCPCEDIELVIISITISCSSKSDLPYISCCDFDLCGFSVSHQVRYLTLFYLILSHLVIYASFIGKPLSSSIQRNFNRVNRSFQSKVIAV